MTTAIKYQKYLRVLPLLDFTASLFSGVDLQKVYLICSQHLVSTTYSLFNTLLNLGIYPENISVIGKCYSTDFQALAEMQALGIDVCSSSLSFQSHVSFDAQYRSNIQKFVSHRSVKLKNNYFKKIIVLDDGGELILCVNSLIEEKNQLIGIEQTSSGYHKIKQVKINYPIINVARSPAKLNYESPIIANLILKTLKKALNKIHVVSKKALIIGNGPIGSHVYEVLKNSFEVLIFDKIASRNSLKQENFETMLKTFDLIIGCTGEPVFNVTQQLKKHVVLVSASSSDREFNAVHLRKKIPEISDCHRHLLIQDRWLANCGFPINFSSDFKEIDCDKLQLTRSLLLLAILQAATSPNTIKKDFIPLCINRQQKIVQAFQSLFAKAPV